MKIDRIRTVRHEEFPNLLHVLVDTDDGLVGTGETFYGAETVEAQVHAVAAPLLLGQDPLRIEAHNTALEGYVGYAGSGAESRARSAIDIALWDVRAQAARMPLYDTMGGRTRESIRAYNTCAGSHYVRRDGQSSRNWGLEAPSERYEDLRRFLTDAGGLAAELRDEGLSGMKIWPFDRYAEASGGTSISPAELRAGLEPLRRIREAVGDDMDVMVELHALWNVPAARRIVRAVAEYGPYWIEDPVRSDVHGGLHALAETVHEHGSMLASGETVAQTAQFLPLVAPGPIDVVTVDLTWCGGITHAMKVAGLAAAAGKAVAPHDCTGPVSLVAATHLSVSAPNALVQETVRAAVRGWYGDVVTDLPPIADGTIRPPDGAGLGTRLQPDYLGARGASVRTSGGRP
jgi:L-alanine-DL-glutamate epimerase-like enolase superfamily enzyme